MVTFFGVKPELITYWNIDDGLIVILWSCVLLVVYAKYNRADVLNSNTLPIT